MTAAVALPIPDPADFSARAAASVPCPAPRLLMDEAAFCAWLASAAPGATLIYYRGHLAHDRTPSAGVLPEQERRRLVAVARRALQAADDGLVHLVQRRHGPGDYSYIAIRARRPARVWR